MANVRAKSLRAAKRIRKNNTAMLIILMVVVALMIALFVQGKRMTNRIALNESRIQELTLQTEKEEQRTEEIRELEDYMQSQEYIEKTAKDKLGLVKDGEMLFKEAK